MSSAGFEPSAFRPQSSTSNESGSGPQFRSLFSIAELRRRPSRPPDYAAENRALVSLALRMSDSPDVILQRLADAALDLCGAHSAGLSLLEESDGRSVFHWRAIAGRWSPHLHGGTPRNFGPCGTVLDRNEALLCSHPERDFPYLGDVYPLLEEGLLIPFYIRGEAVGTIWVVAHDASRRFDSEDLRLMSSLGAFAAAAYQTVQALSAAQRVAAIVDSTEDAVIGTDLNRVITDWNRGAERTFGYSAAEVLGKPIGILLPPDRKEEEAMLLGRIRRDERIERFETVRLRKQGGEVDVSITVSPIKNARGDVVGVSKIARDITERKLRNAQMTSLAHEAEHRARNVLAVVQAIIGLSQSDTPEGLREAILGRVRALSRIHGLLAETRWLGAELHSLVTEELSPYSQRGMRVRVAGPNLSLNPDTAQAIAVAIHELATNAAKYGALSSPAGTVDVEWSHVADGRLSLRWVESGGPAIKPPARRGFGTRVIERMIQGQPEGEVRFDWNVSGLACKIALLAKHSRDRGRDQTGRVAGSPP